MKTDIQPTSLEAYDSIDLSRQQRIIVGALQRLSRSCIADIATYLRWQRSTVSGRLNDLKKAGILIYVGMFRSNTTGRMSQFFRLREIQSELF